LDALLSRFADAIASYHDALAAPITIAAGDGPQILVADLAKHSRMPEMQAGLAASIRSVLWHRFKTVRAVDEVTFSLQPGEIVGFLGPNSAGKTTTPMAPSGLLQPDLGRAPSPGPYAMAA
jgi:ABC-2 type transport system ATP-binding protein